MTEAASLFAAANAANQKYLRNVRTCEFASLTRREADPFVAYADTLDRLKRRSDEANAAWLAAAATLTEAELIAVLSAA